MSLQGPAWPCRVRRVLLSGAHLRRPCILFTVILLVWGESITAQAHCYRVWHYPKPQKCFTALAPLPERARSFRKEAGLVHEERIRSEQNEIPLPHLDDIVWGEIGPEELRAIALLRELYNAR